MAHGGSRKNAGRKSKSRELLIERSRMTITTARITPLEYFMEILQDVEQGQDRRFTAAVAAAPYCHPRLTNATVTTTVKRSVDEFTTAELIAALEQDARDTRVIEAQASDADPDAFH